jgi:hypothetical protein
MNLLHSRKTLHDCIDDMIDAIEADVLAAPPPKRKKRRKPSAVPPVENSERFSEEELDQIARRYGF